MNVSLSAIWTVLTNPIAALTAEAAAVALALVAGYLYFADARDHRDLLAALKNEAVAVSNEQILGTMIQAQNQKITDLYTASKTAGAAAQAAEKPVQAHRPAVAASVAHIAALPVPTAPDAACTEAEAILAGRLQ